MGQSYFGDLAARLLGDALLEWLWAVPAAGVSADDLGTELTTWLTDLTKAGTATVSATSCHPNLAPLIAQVLERKRAEGSATTVTGGRIDLSGDGRIRLHGGGAGGFPARVWIEGTEITVHSAASQVGSGWSNPARDRGGPPSLSMFNSQVKAVRILAYTDGLVSLDPVTDNLASPDLQRLAGSEESQAEIFQVVTISRSWKSGSETPSHLPRHPRAAEDAAAATRLRPP